MGNIWPPGDTNQRELPWSDGGGGVSLPREVERLEKGDAKRNFKRNPFHIISKAGHRHRGQCCQQLSILVSSILVWYRKPSGIRLGPFIPVPDWFQHKHFFHSNTEVYQQFWGKSWCGIGILTVSVWHRHSVIWISPVPLVTEKSVFVQLWPIL